MANKGTSMCMGISCINGQGHRSPIPYCTFFEHYFLKRLKLKSIEWCHTLLLFMQSMVITSCKLILENIAPLFSFKCGYE